ncbi:hypothetical protein [Mesorhizobium sp. URHB0026]
MKLVDLVSLVSDMTELPTATVNEMARALQKAGHIQTGKPGRYGGSEMSSADAAALVIAILGAGEKREVTTSPAIVERSKKMILTAERLHGLPEHDPTGAVEGDSEGINMIFRNLESKETIFDQVSHLLTVRPEVPRPFDLLSYHLAILSPMQFGVLIFNIRNTEIPGQQKYLTASRTKELLYEDPAVKKVGPGGAYEVRRTISGPFFDALRSALAGTDA